MDAYYSYLNGLVNNCKSKFIAYPNIKWINSYSSFEFQEKRNQLLSTIGNSMLFKGTKPYYNHISNGCKLCGEGLWSCLFITGKCNASCFYCPTAQTHDDLPTTQGLTFDSPEAYAEYVSHFKFRGVSFSGGEPLLVKDRLLTFLKEIRKTCAPDIYVWMYTNGILANYEIFKKLASLNLNEVRFDIGATAYNLDKIKYANGTIKNITIEIPAVPEEKERLKNLLSEMVKAGVTNLNLHQLRLTEYNVSRLNKHPYTYIPAEKPIVLESELAALEIIEYAKKQQIDIGINYCSFFFKNRFQPAGFKNRITDTLVNNKKDISPKGYIREFTDNNISYYNLRIANEGEMPESSDKLNLKHKNYSYGRFLSYKQNINSTEEFKTISTLIANEFENPPDEKNLFNIWMNEYIEKGFREY